MVSALSLGLVYLASLWLVGVGLLCAARPEVALRGLASMGSTRLIHFGEHALRGMAGLALVGAAAGSRHPAVFFWAGLFIVASSALIALAPRRWHHAYAVWWARRLPAWSMRLAAPLSIAAGLALAWAAHGPSLQA
ncbi:hypothetical protein [Maricaulis sp. CAU 1757]